MTTALALVYFEGSPWMRLGLDDILDYFGPVGRVEVLPDGGAVLHCEGKSVHIRVRSNSSSAWWVFDVSLPGKGPITWHNLDCAAWFFRDERGPRHD